MGAPLPASAFWLWEDEDKQVARGRLMKARDISALRATHVANDTARRLYWEANALANQWLYARASVTELTEIANGIVRLFLTANLVERMEGSDGE